jgi:hypothetical protein
MAVFWVVAPCSLVEVYQRFRGPCLRHQVDVIIKQIGFVYWRNGNKLILRVYIDVNRSEEHSADGGNFNYEHNIWSRKSVMKLISQDDDD